MEHAQWDSIHDKKIVEVIYVCEKGYYIIGATCCPSFSLSQIHCPFSGTGRATYSIELDAWTNVPECEGSAQLLMRNYWPILLTFITIITVFLAAIIIYIKIRQQYGTTLNILVNFVITAC